VAHTVQSVFLSTLLRLHALQSAEVLMTLIKACEEEHHSIPDASPVEVLRTLMATNGLRQKGLVPIFWL
jgi:antitoxin component HigA of HigAB toxin-antitoxin module